MLIYAISDIHAHLAELEDALRRVDLSGDNRLILLGDYIDCGPESGTVLRRVFDLQKACGQEKIIVLRGNHEEMLLEWLDTYAGPGAGQNDEYGLPPWNDWLNTDPDFQTFRTLITEVQWNSFQQVMPTLSEDSLNIIAAKMVLETNRELIGWLRQLPYFYETEKQIFVHAGIDEEAGDWWQFGSPNSMFVGKYPATTGPFYKDIIAGHIGSCTLAGDPDFHGIYFDGHSHYFIDGTVTKSGRIPVLVYDTRTGKYTER